MKPDQNINHSQSIFVFFPRSSSQGPGYYLKQATIVFFPIHPSLSSSHSTSMLLTVIIYTTNRRAVSEFRRHHDREKPEDCATGGEEDRNCEVNKNGGRVRLVECPTLNSRLSDNTSTSHVISSVTRTTAIPPAVDL